MGMDVKNNLSAVRTLNILNQNSTALNKSLAEDSWDAETSYATNDDDRTEIYRLVDKLLNLGVDKETIVQALELAAGRHVTRN